MKEYLNQLRKCQRFFPLHGYQSISKEVEDLALYLRENGIEADIYGQGDFLNDFESELATKFGFESALFGPSGTMLQGIACRIYKEKTGRDRVALHSSSHLLEDENFAIQHLHGLKWDLIGRDNRSVSYEDTQILSEHHACVVLELPMRRVSYTAIPWSDLTLIKENSPTSLHLDGARIWEVQPYYQKSFQEICEGFSSAYVSFYKGVGALPGSMLMGDSSFIQEARVWLRRYGGNLFNQTLAAASAKMNLDKRMPKFGEYYVYAKKLSKHLQELGFIVGPADMHSSGMTVSFRGDEKQANQRLEALRCEKGIHLCRPFASSKDDGVISTEFQVGDASLLWDIQEVGELFIAVK